MLKLLRFLKPFSLLVAGVLTLVFFQSLAELYLPTLMADIVDFGIVPGDTNFILQTGGFMLLVALAGMIASVTASFLSAKASLGFGKLLRSKLFGHVSQFSLTEFDKFGSASLITRTTNDITQVQMVLLMMLRMMVSAPMMSIGGVIMAVSRNARLSLLLVVVIPILAGTIALVASIGMPLFRALQVKIDKINLVLRENLMGVRVIRAFNRVPQEQQRFDAANLDVTSTALKLNRLMAVMMPTMMLLMNLTAVAIIWFGGIQIDAGTMMLGDLMAFIQYSMQILFALLLVSMMFVMLPRAAVSADRINEVLDTLPSIQDQTHRQVKTSQRGTVEFKDISFSYPGAQQPALSSVSFKAGPGEITAIIGGTGAGKSTLVNLIPRFYDITQGEILVDGTSLQDYPQAQLRAKIGYVPQQILLFSGTIEDNIRYGKEDATPEEIRRAAGIAQAEEFISTLPDGYNSPVSKGGTNLSGGQKQRLSIARALIRRPGIYIFDDSFSALDFRTDARLRSALKAELADSTVLVVAQRVTSVMDAHRIIVLDQGQVAGIGTHQELLESCHIYREIVSAQLSQEEIA
jgi:ATP-binding cassette subfamily B protein